MATASTSPAIASGDLTDLISSSSSTTVYPSDDAILAVLQARFRSDLPYTRIGSSNLVVVNPYKLLANVNDASAREYEERCYRETSVTAASSASLPPHLYDLSARVYLLLRQKNESQAVVFRCVVTSNVHLFSIHRFFSGVRIVLFQSLSHKWGSSFNLH